MGQHLLTTFWFVEIVITALSQESMIEYTQYTIFIHRDSIWNETHHHREKWPYVMCNS
jgi:hypothetical protein